MSRGVRILLGVVALLVGATAVYLAPESSDVTKPIAYRGTIGDRIVGRSFASTVTGVHLARTLRLHDGTRVETPGVWLLVDLRVTTRLDGGSFAASTVTVGDTVFGSYDDPGSADFSGAPPDPGITEEGTLAFELPSSVRSAADADLTISRGALNPDQVDVVRLHPRGMRLDDEVTVVPQSPVALEDPWRG